MRTTLLQLTTLAFVTFVLAIGNAQINPPVELPGQFSQPVDIKHAGDERLFIVEKQGRIWIMDKQGTKSANPFLNIVTLVNSSAGERGLLGLAFHPDFASNGYFFVNYTGAGGHTRISRFSRSATDPNLADPTTEMVLMTINQPFNNHNAGDLAFGPDGYLYIPMGDGGSGGDPGNRSQDPEELLGKMLRVDVDNGIPYSIPPDNPFLNSVDTLPEIWSLGLRNPWRISFDRLTGDLWIADVGQGNWEEINLEPAGSTGGLNWGWRCYEGFAPYNTAGCGPALSYNPPIHVYANAPNVGCSVTGGYVYRGNKHPTLFGKYFYTDFCSGTIWTLEPDGSGGWTNTEVYQGLSQEYSSFGEDNEGELYLAALGEGKIYKIVSSCDLAATIQTTEPLCHGLCDGTLDVNPQNLTPPFSLMLTYPDSSQVIVADTLIVDLCAGTYTYILEDGTGCIVMDTFQIEEPTALSLETLHSHVICPGDCNGTLDIAPSGGCTDYFYIVQSGLFEEDQSTYTDLCAGEYAITVTDCFGCTITATVNIQEPSVMSVQLFWSGDTLFATGGFALYFWYLNDSIVAETTDNTWIPSASGTYRVQSFDNSGCTAVSNEIEVEISSTEEFNSQSFKVWPNPFDDVVVVQVPDIKGITLELIDVWGRPVTMTNTIIDSGGPTVLAMSHLSEGLYVLIARSPDGYFLSKRLVKSGKGL